LGRFQLLVALFILCLLGHKALSQEVGLAIELGENEIVSERPFTISVIVRSGETRPLITFPDIPGFTKRGTTTSVTGDPVVTQIITQNYLAVRPGRYRLAPFTVTVGTTTVRSEGTTITVRPSASDAATPAPAVGKRDVYLSLTTTRTGVYVGEGFTVKLALFVAESYPFELTFYELEQQLQQQLKAMRPANCWEENAGIAEVQARPVRIEGRRYTEYRIYQATFFPLTVQSIQLPAVDLRIQQQRPAAAPGGTPIKEVLSFSSKTARIAVRALPPHPLRERVAVGDYRLTEQVSRRNPATGQSVQYVFGIEGRGNIMSIPQPVLAAEPVLDVFPPEEKHTLQHQEDQITGSKTFRYQLIPRQNGPFPLDRLFRWIYFNPRLERYDTLRSTITLNIGGRNLTEPVDTAAVGKLPGSIYTGLEQTDSSVQTLNAQEVLRLAANVLLSVMILGMMYLLWKK